MPHDSLCNEGFKNVYLVGVRNVEGQNTYGHTVFSFYLVMIFLYMHSINYYAIKKITLINQFLKKSLWINKVFLIALQSRQEF